MLALGYYPGCSLEGTARDYAASIEGVCRLLNIELVELEDWNCCGATAAHSLDHDLSVALPARNLFLARQQGLKDLTAPCALCYNRLKTAQKVLKKKATQEPSAEEDPQVRVWDLVDYFSQPSIMRVIQQRVVRPLHGLRAVCYYGCMVNRPPKITDAPSWENPTAMDRLMETVGAEVLDWPFKTDCCGASHAVARPDLVSALVGKLLKRALDQGAHCIVVSCQMCHANLDLYQNRIVREQGLVSSIPVFYFTDLIGFALGETKARDWIKRHMVDGEPLLATMGR
ncbi:MAG: CoB--CoM heterodisulfide reductase iron-sulfur subunit B family protein [Desulfosoma sp.]|uniref:CoB--CoM heterodisulfide reductase iron-sulfur subunit B family protein n=1 Tax=Desulfosoma sp. TaxID=2603217 RepID=UPI00404B78A8